MTREVAIAEVLGAVQERWGIHSLTRGYGGARGSGILASRATPMPALPPWWPGAEGYIRPSVLELSGPASCGKLGLSLLWLAAADRGGLTAVVDLPGTFYPPAAAASGLDLDRLVVVRPPDRRAAAEAVSLLVSSAGFDAVLWPLDWKSRPYGLDAARLATLAARASTTLLALVTDGRRVAAPTAAAGPGTADEDAPRLFPSADVRLRVTGWEWTWRDGELAGVRPRVRTERLRGAPAGQAWELRLERHGPPDSSDAAGQADADAAPSWTADRAGALAAGRSAGGWPASTARSAASGSSPATARSADPWPATSGGSAASSTWPAVSSSSPGADVRPGRCPPTDHLCLAAALPLGGGSARAAGPPGTPDRGVRPDAPPAPAARTA